jgi:plasmid stability protein
MRQTSVTIRNIPLSVLTRIKSRAAGNHRSMQGELLAILEAAAASPAARRTAHELLGRLRVSGLRTPAESLDMVAADRER